MAKKSKKPKDLSPRFGIGEWFGKPLTKLTSTERREYAADQLKDKKLRAKRLCPFKPGKDAKCTKDGGVCSLRLYSYKADPGTGRATGEPVAGVQGDLRITCPSRFYQNLDIFRWVGETILGDNDPKLAAEVGFLEASATTDSTGGDDVGRIDMVLVTHKNGLMEWCALEIQAVYFSGDAMRGEFKAFADETVQWVIFPAGRRRPDYRSSAPKRLMPQLQIKVPTLRRWGKKMAVVVDRAFFDSMGEMDKVADISNADICWFIVGLQEVPDSTYMKLVRQEVRFTTLERSVEGLTGGKPVAKSVFEQRIAEKLAPAAAAVPDLLTGIEETETADSGSADSETEVGP